MVKRNSNTRNSGSSFNGQTITLYEQINVYKLQYIIDHHADFNLHELFHATSAGPQTREGQLTLLRIHF
jgi:hypothetical protein